MLDCDVDAARDILKRMLSLPREVGPVEGLQAPEVVHFLVLALKLGLLEVYQHP